MARFWNRRKTAESSPEPIDPATVIRHARRLRYQIRPQAVIALSGAYLGARPGTGLTFAELRAYEPGDDVRHLDWNVTARLNRPFVRRYIEERSLNLWIIVDVSASLRFGPDGRQKADRAAQAAALLAAAAVQNGDLVGLILVSDRIEAELPPGGGTRHLARLLRMLVATPAPSRKTNLGVALSRVGRIKRRGLIVVVSDFLTLDPPALWRRARRHHDVLAVRVTDPREEILPNVGLLRLEDAESGARRVVNTHSRRVRALYRREADERQKAFTAWSREAGARTVAVSTDEDPIEPLLRLFRGRGRPRGAV
jgi:uncharacterized protein (DUF58 family)